MRINRKGEFPGFPGSADNFTGDVTFTDVYLTDKPGRIVGGTVQFEAGARTHWHSHPFGQILIVTEGTGWTQCEGEERVEIRKGSAAATFDVVHASIEDYFDPASLGDIDGDGLADVGVTREPHGTRAPIPPATTCDGSYTQTGFVPGEVRVLRAGGER